MVRNRTKRAFFILFLLALTTVMYAQRQIKTINDRWSFYLGECQEAQSSCYIDSNWIKVNIPHTWNNDAYQKKNYYQGKGWYRRHLFVPAFWKDKDVYLKIDAASKWADVYVNGEKVKSHPGGYTDFIIDITDKVLYGKDNIIAIEVDNSRKDVTPISADFTFWGGVYRDVWILTTSKEHFAIDTETGSDNIFISTPDVSENRAIVCVKGSVTINSTNKNRLRVINKLYSPGGELLQTNINNINTKASAMSFSCRFKPVMRPLLWSPENPHLYKVETILTNSQGQELDRMTHNTAFRWFSVDGNKGFFLNGKPYKLRGFCRHQDQKPVGVAISDEMNRRDFDMMKDMGANFIRISHYPQDDALLEMCDKKGMLVWEEIPIVNTVPDTPGYADNCEFNLKEMIRQHYNHPSIFSWAYMNEVLLMTMRQYKGKSLTDVIQRTKSLAHRLEMVLEKEDPYRKSAMALHYEDIYNKVGLTDITNILGWNIYSGWYSDSVTDFEKFLSYQHTNHPTHPIIVSEWGAGSDIRLHSLNPHQFDFSSEYQQTYIEHYNPVIEDSAYVCGSSYWNFIDFNVAGRQESMPRTNNKGVTYNNRTPKDVYYYFKSAWRKDIPVLHIASRDWNRRCGIQRDSLPVILPVKIYTNQPEVELFIDNKSLGKKTVKNYNAIFEVPFSSTEPLLYAKAGDVSDAVKIHYTTVPYNINSDNVDNMELAVNVGSNCYFTSSESQLTWVPDKEYTKGSWGYIGGEISGTQTEVNATMETPLYQTQRKGLNGYRFDLPNGEYEVELLFSDIYKNKEQEVYLLNHKEGSSISEDNCFDISINGDIVENRFCPSAFSGKFFAVKRRYIVGTTESKIEINFKANQGVTFLSGIKIRKI